MKQCAQSVLKILITVNGKPNFQAGYCVQLMLAADTLPHKLAVVHSELFTTASLPSPAGTMPVQPKNFNRMTNARIAALHGLSVGPLPARPCPCHSPQTSALVKASGNGVGRKSGGLSIVCGSAACADALATFQPSLRLRSTSSARRPQTEASAKLENLDHYSKNI